MFKFNLTLLTIITFSYGITHPPRNTLQWNPNNFGNWRTVKKGSPHKNKIKLNDVILAVPSSGLHSNGFSLVRHILKKKKNYYLPQLIKKELIKPTKIYVKD